MLNMTKDDQSSFVIQKNFRFGFKCASRSARGAVLSFVKVSSNLIHFSIMHAPPRCRGLFVFALCGPPPPSEPSSLYRFAFPCPLFENLSGVVLVRHHLPRRQPPAPPHLLASKPPNKYLLPADTTMIRFSLRSRSRHHRKNHNKNHKSSPHNKNTLSSITPTNPTTPTTPPPSNSSDPPSSYLVNYDVLPTRNRNRHAIDYAAYLPSRYYIPSNTRRKPRNNNLREASRALHLDFDTLSRMRSTEDIIPLDKRIKARIAELRRLLAETDQLGDVEVLKDLVGIHEAKVSRGKQQAEILRLQIREAKIIARLTDPDDRVPLVRKVSGRPSRHFAGRTVSALKARTTSMRSNSRNNRASLERENVSFREHTSTSPSKQTQDPSVLSRKSSARLKRLGSAGSILIRRLSKVSVSEEASTGSSNEQPAVSPFDADMVKRLKTNPLSVISEFEAELAKFQESDTSNITKLQESQRQLDMKRNTNSKIMEILDQFYGNLPAWEDDPISHEMFPETADLTEAGLEAERDLADARGIRERARAAREDHARTVNGLNTIATELGIFIDDLEQLILALDARNTAMPINFTNTLRALRQNLEKCARSSRMAVECCPEAPRILQLRRDVQYLLDGFVQEANAVLSNGTIYQSEFRPALHVARTILSDCKVAETFVSERQILIAEDLAKFERSVERCEEYVILERVSILDLHHPTRSDFELLL